jgi:oligoendopeptidase F
MQQIQFIGQEFANKLSDITNVLIKNENKIMSYLQYKELQAYKLYFANIFRYKKHILSEPEEKILTELSSTHNGFESIFSILSNGDIKFQDAINSKSKKIPIKTISDVMIFLKHKDRKIRETA